MKIYKIIKITDRNGIEKHDQIYLFERGFMLNFNIGWHFIFQPVEQTYENKGILKTSYIESIIDNDRFKIITTQNSIYHLMEE